MYEHLLAVNLILYCAEWESTVRFYRDGLGLPVNMANDWFVEFLLGPGSRLSVADERHASIKSCGSTGLAVALEVADVDAAWERAAEDGLNPTVIRDHPWGARLFFLYDPEGHRIEIWQGGIRPASAPDASGR